MSQQIKSSPKKDGFRMPGEFEEHEGTWMLWPERKTTWRNGAKPAQKAYIDVAKAIVQFEPVTVGVSNEQFEHARAVLPADVRLVELSSDDAWIRDSGATFVTNDKGEVRGIDWGFNCKGGMYFPWDKDILTKQKMMEIERIDRYNARDFIIEGGAFTVDGEGTVITTKSCLLNSNRNPGLSKKQIEDKLREYLNVQKVIWLDDGLINDDTDGHVDELVFFSRPGEVVMSWTEDKNDSQYDIFQQSYEILKNTRDAKERNLKIHKVQIPKQIKMTEEEREGLDISDDNYFLRDPDTTFPSSYINCYLCNGAIIIPAFGDEQDKIAYDSFKKIFPDRKVVQVMTKEISYGGGNIHCITLQQPKA